MRYITLKHLEEIGACSEPVSIFKKLFGNRVHVSRKNVREWLTQEPTWAQWEGLEYIFWLSGVDGETDVLYNISHDPFPLSGKTRLHKARCGWLYDADEEALERCVREITKLLLKARWLSRPVSEELGHANR